VPRRSLCGRHPADAPELQGTEQALGETRGKDPYAVSAPLYQVDLTVFTDTTAIRQTMVYRKAGGPTDGLHPKGGGALLISESCGSSEG
jgi:hypothetical protein